MCFERSSAAERGEPMWMSGSVQCQPQEIQGLGTGRESVHCVRMCVHRISIALCSNCSNCLVSFFCENFADCKAVANTMDYTLTPTQIYNKYK